MCGLGHVGWVICLLTVSLGAGQATGQEFLFTELSCKDLVPRHRDAFKMAPSDKNTTNHVKPQNNNDNDTTATQMEPASVPTAQEYSGDVDVEVLTSETTYRRLKSLIVTLQSPIYFNGFMVQARKAGKESGGEIVVGRFMKIPHRGKYLTCPNGDKLENTVASEDAPLRMANLTFTWMAPQTDLGNIKFIASILYNGGTDYKIYSSPQLTLNMYPVSTKECAVAKSCFRYCTKQGGRQCEAHMSQYVATLEYRDNMTSVSITIGGQLPQPEGYLAVGFSKDNKRMENADIAACYRTENTATEEDTVKLEHYLLKDISFMPDLHLGVLELETWDVDGDFVWCTFTRPITGLQDNRLDLQEPQYYYYFWGTRNGSTISLPPMTLMKRSTRKISTKDKPFNQIDYSSGYGKSRSPYTIVAALVLLLSVHFLCW